MKFNDYFSFKQNMHDLRGSSMKIQLRSDLNHNNKDTLAVHYCFLSEQRNTATRFQITTPQALLLVILSAIYPV